MAWEDYEAIVSSEWNALLGSLQQGQEKRVQTFLETHPCMIPGASHLPFRTGKGSFPAAVISQPPLRGLSIKVPDFMWLTMDSGSLHVILIEIESPLKKWFTRDGTQRSEFTQAQTQLVSWRQWFAVPEHRALFYKTYKIPSDLQKLYFNLVLVLIYGRRQEFEDNPLLNERRAYLTHENEYLMTFDRLAPDREAKSFMCVKLVESPVEGPVYEAVSVPPTLRLEPLYARYRSYIGKRDSAVNQNPWITPERKQFLLERFAYWDQWTREHRGGMMRMGYEE